MPKITNFSIGRNKEKSQEAPTLLELRQEVRSQAKAKALIALVEEWGSREEPVSLGKRRGKREKEKRG